MRFKLYSCTILLCLLVWVDGNAQISADFGANMTEACGSLNVDFEDLSNSSGGNITSWLWRFGDGSTSSLENPSKIYADCGYYEVCLTVGNQSGDTDTECRTGFIAIHCPPDAEFIANGNARGCSPLTVTFQDRSTFSDLPIVRWIWDLGGSAGVIITEDPNEVIQSTYTISDIYNVTLTVVDEFGCRGTATLTSVVEVLPSPDVDLDANKNFACTAPLTVDFTNDDETSGVTYEWDFGNGQTFTGPKPPLVVYQNNGSFDITITATNNTTGCTNVATYPGFVSIGTGVTFDLTRDSLCIGEEVTFFDLSTTQASSLSWDFGDGSPNVNVPVAMHSYDNPGMYTVTLTRNDIDGCTVMSSRDVFIFEAPTITIQADKKLGCEDPLVVNYSATAPPNTSFFWEVGPGGFDGGSTQQNPTFTIGRTGTFPVKLTASSPGGCTTEVLDTIIKYELQANSDVLQVLGCPPINVPFQDGSGFFPDVSDDVDIVAWNWTVGTETSTQENPTLTFANIGVFDLCLEVTDENGCMDKFFKEEVVSIGTAGTADFSVNGVAGAGPVDHLWWRGGRIY